MDLSFWLPALPFLGLLVLGLVALGLMVAFVQFCDQV